MKRKKRGRRGESRRRERGRWKVKPGFLEGNAPVNPAHKSSTINRVTGWAVNRKHVLRQSPTQRPSTSLFHANARHWRIFSFDCAPVLRFYTTPFVFNALRTLLRFAIECPFQSNFSRIRVSWRCFIFFFFLSFFFLSPFGGRTMVMYIWMEKCLVQRGILVLLNIKCILYYWPESFRKFINLSYNSQNC